MAALGSRANRLENGEKQSKSPLVSPLKVRELLNEGVASEDTTLNCSQQDLNTLSPNGLGKAPFEAANKDFFFNRVETYSCLKWAGKPHALSPLRCAGYGWINVECDMLKCSSCQAFLCASIQTTLDFQKYEGRISELLQQLQSQHEKFCSWPDFPCPDRFWMVPINEPTVLFGAFLDRFKSACLLEQQLPAMKPEQFKAMTLTEDVISVLLQLIEDEQVKLGGSLTKASSDPLSVQVAACIVALCGWAASPALHSMNLPILSCSYCMRKVGLWNFFQMECVLGEGENPPQSPTSTTSLTPSQGTCGEKGTSPSPSQSPTPCRMKLRSQDTTRSEQKENTPSPLDPRTRTRDSPIPHEELPSPLPRGKRPMTRSRGQGENLAVDVPSSPQRKTKHPRLSASGPEGPLHRNVFDPVAQHRDWCPWVIVGQEERNLNSSVFVGCEEELPQPVWKAALNLFISLKSSPVGSSPSQGPRDKSKRVFSIFQQWQVYSPFQ